MCESNWLGHKTKLKWKEKLMEKRILMKVWIARMLRRDWECVKVINWGRKKRSKNVKKIWWKSNINENLKSENVKERLKREESCWKEENKNKTKKKKRKVAEKKKKQQKTKKKKNTMWNKGGKKVTKD